MYSTPGIISSVTAAPPITCLLSSTQTFSPAFCRYAAYQSPQPTTITPKIHYTRFPVTSP